ncbi:hypothetical protein ACS0TY_005548 [Phlomoides rotata]
MDLLIPGDNLIYDVGDLIVAIVESIYLSIADNYRTNKYFENRAILSPTHREVECINERVLSVMPSDTREYLSSGSICRSEFRSEGVSIMLLRNIDQKSGLCNGTRLIVTKLGNRILEANIISGRNIGSKVFIPRMTLANSDQTTPIKFQRRDNRCRPCVCIFLSQYLHTDSCMLPFPESKARGD